MGVASGKIVSRVPCPPFSQTLPTPLVGVREKAARDLMALRGPVLGGVKKKFPVDAEREMESLFHFPKKCKLGRKTALSSKQRCVWKHRFVCLAYTDQTRIPTSDFEKDEAGLGEREIEFYSQDIGFDGIKDVLFNEFPRLGWISVTQRSS